MLLDDIVRAKREVLAESKKAVSRTQLEHEAKSRVRAPHIFRAALSKPSPSVHLICELKQASPSHGVLRKNFDPLALIAQFEMGGATAISVLTEERYFKGSPEILKRVRTRTKLPILRKDFILDPYQIYEAAAWGADAFLIIAMLHAPSVLQEFIALGTRLGLDPLVEVHDEKELSVAVAAGAQVIGINNRNLRTLEIDTSVSEQLIRFVPENALTIIESGISSGDEVTRLASFGARCFLVGTSLMQSSNIVSKMKELKQKV